MRLKGIPEGTPVAVTSYRFRTGRRYFVVMPYDMNADELTEMWRDLQSLLGTLDGLRRKAEAFERRDPSTAKRESWESCGE